MVLSLVLAANNYEDASMLFLLGGEGDFSFKLGDFANLVLGDLLILELRISSTSICFDYSPPINYIYR